jgi:hypothetical protein
VVERGGKRAGEREDEVMDDEGRMERGNGKGAFKDCSDATG